MLKTCTGCREAKALDLFYASAKSKDGRQSRCKDCAKAGARRWNAENRDRKNSVAKATRESWTPERREAEAAKRRERREADPDKVKAQHRESYHRNRETAIARQRAYRQTPEAKARARERYAEFKERNPRAEYRNRIRRTYGLSIEEFDALVLAQLGRCAICGTELVSLVVDHCHDSLKVRGLLCSPCNTGLGLFRDRPDILRAAIEYLG